MERETILLVEDEQDIRELIKLYLLNDGFKVLEAQTREEALKLFQGDQPDLVILDILLPDSNGIEVCQRIRDYSAIPIIFVSCKRDAEDIITGLESGGDDYITKPFDPGIVLARVKANLRRSRIVELNNLETRRYFGHLVVDLSSFEVWVRGEFVSLFTKERQLLFYLLQYPNQVFSVAHLYDQIWGIGGEGDERTVMVHISNLRKKIEADPANPKYIQTVRGFGYKFNADDSD